MKKGFKLKFEKRMAIVGILSICLAAGYYWTLTEGMLPAGNMWDGEVYKDAEGNTGTKADTGTKEDEDTKHKENDAEIEKGGNRGRNEDTGKDADIDTGKDTDIDTGKDADTNKDTDKEKEHGEKKKIALSFDDGPHPYYTEDLLDVLKEKDVQATFFITGENAALYPDIVKREQEEGHVIGNHTYYHTQLTSGNEQAFIEELVKTNEVIKEITGEDTVFVRPPYGTWKKSFEGKLSLLPVLWDIDPLDWCSDNVACIVQNIVVNAGDCKIILMHDQYESSVTAVGEVIDILREEGYEFVTIEEVLFD